MPKVNPDDLIRDLTLSIEWLKEHAHDKIEEVERDNPGLGEAELFTKWQDEVTRALDGLNPDTIATVSKRSFLELRRRRAGFNPDHVGGA